jgi:hypothetical protein
MSDEKTAVITEPRQGVGSSPPARASRFAAFPPSVRLAVVVGHPSEAGPYTIRVRVPYGVKLMPHRHPEDRVYTVVSSLRQSAHLF